MYLRTESFDSFSGALKTQPTALPQHLHMRQFKDAMQYNQAFRQIMLCLEDMNYGISQRIMSVLHVVRPSGRSIVLQCVRLGALIQHQQWQKFTYIVADAHQST